MDFKCLFCLNQIKDGDLVCTATCDHKVHEWCIDSMKAMNDRRCKICNKMVAISLIYKEFDTARESTIAGMALVIEKLDEIINLMKSKEDFKKDFKDISDKLEGLSIEHHALKFEKGEIEKRVKSLEGDKNV